MSHTQDIEAIRTACERSISFVFAPNASCGSNLYECGAALCAARMAAVFIMADASIADEAVNAMRQLGRKGRGPLVQAAEFDFSTAYGIDTSSADFHAEQLPDGLLLVMRSLAESMLDVYEHIVIADATLPAPSQEDVWALFDGSASGQPHASLHLIERSQLDSLD